MKQKARQLLLSALLGVGIVACQMTASDNRAEVEANAAQDKRGAVNTAFAERGDKAVDQYREVWNSRHADAQAPGEVIEMLAIAGQLLGRDVGNYNKYYSYITEKLQSTSLEVQGSALAALSNATDEASLRMLFDASADDRIRIAAESIAALDYRYQTALADSSRQGEAKRIQMESIKLCREGQATPPLRAYCDRNQF